jgi:Protein of unknown function (DUF3604)
MMKRLLKCVLHGSVATTAIVSSGIAHADEADRRVALFGDVHVHTQLSFDSYIFGIRRTPDDAYRYALGESVRHANGYDIALKGGPLDFYAVTDHSEYLGVLPEMDDKSSPMSMIDYAQDMFSSVRDKIAAAFGKVFQSITDGKPIPEMDNKEVVKTTWQELQSTADRFYQPGKFTTFAGFEYTAQPGYGNLHRVVLFRTARRPDLPFSSLDSVNPEKLWDYLDENRTRGIDGIAIPHNSNVSNGLMFQLTDFAGNPISAKYAETRMRNEPIVEMSQVKGTSDTHPSLSPNDEWADYEIYSTLLGTDVIGKTDGSYVRQALQRGLEIEAKTGKNPYKFGLIGSSDTHNAGGPIEEDHYFGKTGFNDGTPEGRRVYAMPGEENLRGAMATPFYKWSAAGLAGVWAERNNREDIFAAMRRKETFATSGPRIKVRLFAGHGYPANIWASASFAKTAYANGVPMGGDLRLNGKGAPTFLAQAMKDPNSAGLQRIQIIRGWVENGATKEQVYDVACAKGVPNPTTHRCPASAETINTKTCKINPAQGAAELKVAWRDPDFSAARRAFYYVRVLENPTCRWSTWEANRLGKKLRPGLPLTIQERGWSSPIWVGA